MSDIRTQMLHELRKIRELLEQGRPLGFGKQQEPVYVFIRHASDSLWYIRDKHAGENMPIHERDLTGYLRNLWRYDRVDTSTQETVPKLMLEIQADKHYIIQSGLETNFSKSLLTGLLELEPKDLEAPLTLIVEDNASGRGRPTVFARLEVSGQRLKPTFDRKVIADEVLSLVNERFGFSSPYGKTDGD